MRNSVVVILVVIILLVLGVGAYVYFQNSFQTGSNTQDEATINTPNTDNMQEELMQEEQMNDELETE